MVRLPAPTVNTEPLGVIFDLDGTLYHQGFLRALMAACLASALLRAPFKAWKTIQILRHYRKAQEWLRNNPFAEISPDSQLERAQTTTGVPVSEIREHARYWMEEVPLRFLPLCTRRRLRRLIRRWHAFGVPMGVYSDYPSNGKLRRLGLQELLPSAVCSTDSQVRAFKPDPRGLQLAAARLGLPPERVVYVGDREEVDGVGARRAGMQSLIVGGFFRRLTRGSGSMTMKHLDTVLARAYGRT